MNLPEAASILRQLLIGADPDTGEALPEASPLQSPTIREALLTALQAMGAAQTLGYIPANRNGRLNAGRPWTEADLSDLRTLYEGGMPIPEIARLTHRHERGVRFQLNLLLGGGKSRSARVAIPEVIQAASLEDMAKARRGAFNRNRPWTAEADAELTQQFQAGADPSQLALALGRSAYAIELRLQHLGLLPAANSDSPLRPWSKEDVAELRRLHKAGMSAADIAAHTHRTEEAVSARMFYMGLGGQAPALCSADAPAPLPAADASRPASAAAPDALRPLLWTPKELQQLQQHYLRGMPIREIAEATGRSEKSIRLHLNLMAGGSPSLEGRLEIPEVYDARIVPPLEPARVRPLPENSYEPWNPQEEAQLAEMYDAGKSIREMSQALQRTPGGIRKRLKRCGFDPGKASAAAAHWTPETIAHLKTLHTEGWSIPEIAQTLRRTQIAITNRLQKLGLLPESSASLAPDRPWTETDSEQLEQLVHQEMNITDIADALNRTSEAVRAHLASSGTGSSAPSPANPSPALTPSRRWTPEEDAYLRQAWAEDVPLADIVRQTGRKDRLVRCRLIFLGLADHGLLDGPPVPPELCHQGLPWYPEEIDTLQHMFRQGRSIRAMAAELKRSEGVVRSRLELLGLREEGPE